MKKKKKKKKIRRSLISIEKKILPPNPNGGGREERDSLRLHIFRFSARGRQGRRNNGLVIIEIYRLLSNRSLALDDRSGKSFRRIRFHPVGRREGGGGKRREDASHTRVERKKRGKERDDRHREGVSRSTNLSRIEWDRWGRY